MNVIITVLDDITETSMPFNEFVVYRGIHYKEQYQCLVVCGEKKKLPKVEIPKNIKIIYVGSSPFKIRRALLKIINKCKKSNIEYLVHMHHVKSALIAFLSMSGTGYRKKVLFTVHSTFTGYSLHNKILSLMDVLLANQITCVSNAAYENYPDMMKKIKGERIQGVENGVDTERIDSILGSNVCEKSKDGSVDLIYVARMVPVKNHKFLIDVMKELPRNFHLILIGAEDPKGEIRKQAEDYGVAERVTFTGLIPRKEVFKKLYSADIYVSPSVLEGLPISVLEAMYCELPVILSNIEPHKEVAKSISTEDKFIHVLPLDKQVWIDIITKIVEEKKDMLRKLGQKSKCYVNREFSLKHMHKDYDHIYEKLFKDEN